jgi:hypothetical protein
MAGWFPGHSPRRPRGVDVPTARRLTLRFGPKRRLVFSMALVDVRRTSDTTRV